MCVSRALDQSSMKATPHLSTQIYCVEIGGTDRERKMEGGSDRSGSEGRKLEEKQKRGRERRRGEVILSEDTDKFVAEFRVSVNKALDTFAEKM